MQPFYLTIENLNHLKARARPPVSMLTIPTYHDCKELVQIENIFPGKIIRFLMIAGTAKLIIITLATIIISKISAKHLPLSLVINCCEKPAYITPMTTGTY